MNYLFLFSALFFNSILTTYADEPTSRSAKVIDACGFHEQWKFATDQPETWMKRFQSFMKNQETPWMSFSDAIQLKKISRIRKDGRFDSDFSEYWVGRILHHLGLYTMAKEYFESSVQHAKSEVIRKASMECIRKIDDPGISRPQDMDHLLKARELYSRGQFEESIPEFQKVDKRSNLKIDSLSDLSWAYLQSGKYQETVGIALQLRAGSFKNTFAPEAMMTAAMALNETCSYPDASRIIQLFIRDYGTAYDWLSHSEQTSPYAEIKMALNQKSNVPVKIRSEWIRHPGFLVRQQEINRLISNHQTISGIPGKISIHKQALHHRMVVKIKNLISKLKQDQKKNSLAHSSEWSIQFKEIRKDLRSLVRYQRATRTLSLALKRFDQTIPERQSLLVSEIDRDLLLKNRELKQALTKVRENIDLIEVEIYQGVSKDLLGLKKIRKKTAPTPSTEHAPILAWNWGSFSAGELDRAEIWEDEIGALKADTKNHCH